MKICTICKRQAHGFAFIKPPFYASDKRDKSQSKKLIRHFCSRNCQEIFYRIFTNHPKENNMIDLTITEKEAIESALKPVGEYVAEIGINRPIASYSREEVLCLIEVVLSAYFDFMQNKEKETEIAEDINNASLEIFGGKKC